MSYNVREYVPKHLRCLDCQRFGHTALNCKEKRRCAIDVVRIMSTRNVGEKYN